jgi:hypothetical protein
MSDTQAPDTRLRYTRKEAKNARQRLDEGPAHFLVYVKAAERSVSLGNFFNLSQFPGVEISVVF